MLRRDILKKQEMRDEELFGFGVNNKPKHSDIVKAYILLKKQKNSIILSKIKEIQDLMSDIIIKGLIPAYDGKTEYKLLGVFKDDIGKSIKYNITHLDGTKYPSNEYVSVSEDGLLIINYDYKYSKYVKEHKDNDDAFQLYTTNMANIIKYIKSKYPHTNFSIDGDDSYCSVEVNWFKLIDANKDYTRILDKIVSDRLNKDKEEMVTTKGTYVAIDVENHEQLYNWFKDQGIEPIVSTEMHCTIAYSRVEFNIDNYIGRIIIKPEQFIGIEELGNEGCAVLKYNSDELQSRFNTCMSAGATYDYDTYIPHTTFALNLTKEQISKLKVPNFDIVLVGEYTDELNIEWKSKINKDEESIMDKKNKTSYIVSGELSTIVSDPIAYMDSEAFSAISGLAANGFKKVSDIVSEIIDGFTPSVPDYSKLTKGFIFDKGKRFQDIYSTTVGVPAGYTGYVLDVSKYVVDNLHYINTLNKELDNTINILSMYINSADYRESFILDLTAVKAIESIATDLFNSNKKYITASKEDSKPIGKLLRSASEVDDVVDNLKEAGSLLDLKTLDTIKFKMKQVDDLISTMIDNKNVYSKNKLMEIAKLIDAIISLSNGVATIVYLKNSTDIILEDIRVVL